MNKPITPERHLQAVCAPGQCKIFAKPGETQAQAVKRWNRPSKPWPGALSFVGTITARARQASVAEYVRLFDAANDLKPSTYATPLASLEAHWDAPTDT